MEAININRGSKDCVKRIGEICSNQCSYEYVLTVVGELGIWGEIRMLLDESPNESQLVSYVMGKEKKIGGKS